MAEEIKNLEKSEKKISEDILRRYTDIKIKLKELKNQEERLRDRKSVV